MSTSVYALLSNTTDADRIVDELRQRGHAADDISLLFPDKKTTHDFAHEKSTKAPEGATAGVTTGGVVGGALGWLIGIGTLAIPGVGPFIAAGPIMAALSGVAIGATVGGIAGALIGMGIPEYEAKRYEGKIREGGILISVTASDNESIAEIKDVFESWGAFDISTANEAALPVGAQQK